MLYGKLYGTFATVFFFSSSFDELFQRDHSKKKLTKQQRQDLECLATTSRGESTNSICLR